MYALDLFDHILQIILPELFADAFVNLLLQVAQNSFDILADRTILTWRFGMQSEYFAAGNRLVDLAKTDLIGAARQAGSAERTCLRDHEFCC